MPKGWVYVTSNTELAGLVKVGFSTKVPSVRAKELTSTGLPEPHIVEYEVLVENPYDVEQEVHRRLAGVHYKREFFRCHASVAVATIRAVVDGLELYESASPKTIEEADRERQREINERDPWFQRRKLMANWVICEACGKQYERTTGHPCPVRNPSLR